MITAAGRGIGAEIALELTAADYQLVLMSRSNEASEFARELGGSIGLVGSVTEENDLRRLVEKAMNNFGRIDAVVNNTGPSTKGDLLEISDDEWHANSDLLVRSSCEPLVSSPNRW